MRAHSAAHLAEDPVDQFRTWFRRARSSRETLPEAATLATVSRSGQPSARVILLKGFDASGFVFYTNYRSRKAIDLAANPRAALVFHWKGLERQVRIEGRVRAISPAESDAYFATRPRGSQLGAWASPQSAVVPSGRVLERRFAAAARRFRGDVPRPTHWGGYRLRPSAVEFWQGRADRMHDRFVYRRTGGGKWTVSRLAP